MNWHLTMNRKYPIGIQTFSEIIRGGYVYIDKTDLVWQLAHYTKIDSKDYALPFHTDGRKVVKVGVKFNAETRVPEDWVIDNG